MRRTKRSGNYLLVLLINMLLNFELSIPAWVLLILHFVIDLSIWWFIGALGVWVVSAMSAMWVVGWANRYGNVPDRPKENKNPYSNKNSNFK